MNNNIAHLLLLRQEWVEMLITATMELTDLFHESSLSLSLQGAVTRCEVDAVPMFVFFRKKKVLYQVGMVWYGMVCMCVCRNAN